MSIQISNDQQLREALNNLPLEAQRKLGSRFVSSISELSQNPLILQGIQALETPEPSAIELESLYKRVKKLAIDSYTACGRDADWSAQAEHFAAAALADCLIPEGQVPANNNIAWKAAMHARMARNCEMIQNDQGEVDNEATRQYQIVTEFLQ